MYIIVNSHAAAFQFLKVALSGSRTFLRDIQCFHPVLTSNKSLKGKEACLFCSSTIFTSLLKRYLVNQICLLCFAVFAVKMMPALCMTGYSDGS